MHYPNLAKSKLAKSLVQRSITLGTLTPKFTVLETNAAKTQNHRLEPPRKLPRFPLHRPLLQGEAEAGERTRLTSSEDAP